MAKMKKQKALKLTKGKSNNKNHHYLVHTYTLVILATPPQGHPINLESATSPNDALDFKN